MLCGTCRASRPARVDHIGLDLPFLAEEACPYGVLLSFESEPNLRSHAVVAVRPTQRRNIALCVRCRLDCGGNIAAP